MTDSSKKPSSSATRSGGDVYLVVIDGTRCGITPLRRRRNYCIGRSGKCDIVVQHEKTSRRHCEVFHRDGKWYVRDLESRNGTQLNGCRIIGEDRLQPGDVVEVAKTRIVFTNELSDAERSLGSFDSELLSRETEMTQLERPTESRVPNCRDSHA